MTLPFLNLALPILRSSIWVTRSIRGFLTRTSTSQVSWAYDMLPRQQPEIELSKGNLRWRAPAAPYNVSGVQLACSDPPQCYQGTLGSSLTNPVAARNSAQSEDCLFLSVYSPALNSTKPLPTIVWIHGGGLIVPAVRYVFGSASDFNGAELVQESNREVVVVVLQYRLGLFSKDSCYARQQQSLTGPSPGFFAGQQVKDGGALNADPKIWAETAFSGDPEKVTIWGESAGAGSVLQHIVANNGRTSPQLFRAGITSSTFLPSQYGYNDRIPACAPADMCTTGDSLECLRGVDSTSLQDINLSMIVAGFQGTFTFVPVADGSFIAQRPTDLLAQSHLNGDILLSVTNSNEGTLFVNQSIEYDVAQYARNLFPLFGTRESAAVASVYQSQGSPLEQVNAIMGECFNYSTLVVEIAYFRLHALHGDDIFHYFPSFTFPGSMLHFNNTAFSTAFAQAFLSFAANLDPNAKLVPSITPVWRKWPGAHMEMVFNRTESGTPWIAAAPTSQALLERCNVVQSWSYSGSYSFSYSAPTRRFTAKTVSREQVGKVSGFYWGSIQVVRVTFGFAAAFAFFFRAVWARGTASGLLRGLSHEILDRLSTVFDEQARGSSNDKGM
ncbi:Alpha/Beta hydrolase protein [Mycena latifolia]|nr:Alpha/Beta hydrolase protein [Mycena latifolia]